MTAYAMPSGVVPSKRIRQTRLFLLPSTGSSLVRMFRIPETFARDGALTAFRQDSHVFTPYLQFAP